ncbi:MAG TPA: glycosyltransferase [Planctomycetota bacterium]|nr:glycosyltransferase [Planctomycetota bacterium]
MTTVAFFCMREPGHFQRMRSLVAGVPALGMEAVVFTHRDFRGYVERAGGTFVDLFAKYPPADADAKSLPVPCRHVSFAGRYADDIRRDVEALGTSLVVYDTFAVVGFVVARSLGIPCVNVCAGHNVEPSRFLEILARDPRVKVAPECHRAVETLRTRHGIADASPFSYVTALSPHLNVYCEPPEFLGEAERRPFAPIAFLGSLPSLEEPFDPVEGAEEVAFAGKGLKVYASFGTVVWRYYAREALAALGAISEAIAARPDAEAVLSLGGAEVDAAPIARPRVRVAKYVDQTRILAEADLHVTHHGLNSTHEAIFRGVPMLSYPFFWDQPALARKCREFGLALPLAAEPRAAIGPEDVHAALDEAVARRAETRAALVRARAWEEAVMANRSSVLRKIATLAGA